MPAIDAYHLAKRYGVVHGDSAMVSTQGNFGYRLAMRLNDAGVPVSTIAFGTEDGIIFIEGEAIPVPPDLAAMEQIAEATGGVTFEAESEQELEAAYADLGSSIGFETEERPVTEWFIGAALVGLLGAAVLSLLWFSRLP